MKNKKTKYLCAFLAALLVLCLPLGVFAVKNGLFPSSFSGGYDSVKTDRVDISLDKTEFTLTKTSEGPQTFLLSAVLTVRKGEPDIFARLNSVDVSGINCNYVLFTAAEDNGDERTPEGLVLRTDKPLRWTVEISLDAAAKTTILPELTVDFDSGLTEETADGHLLSIPLEITIIE